MNIWFPGNLTRASPLLEKGEVLGPYAHATVREVLVLIYIEVKTVCTAYTLLRLFTCDLEDFNRRHGLHGWHVDLADVEFSLANWQLNFKKVDCALKRDWKWSSYDWKSTSRQPLIVNNNTRRHCMTRLGWWRHYSHLASICATLSRMRCLISSKMRSV